MEKTLPIWLALDGMSLADAKLLVKQVRTRVLGVKVHSLVDQYGAPTIIGLLKESGASKVWVDAKLHDIPNTAVDRARVLSKGGADVLTLHASGGLTMMRQVAEAVQMRTKLYAVTFLTSLSDAEAEEIYRCEPKFVVLELARLAHAAGMDGIVCSAVELPMLAERKSVFKGLEFIVPGNRSSGKDVGDQKRVGTPRAALEAGGKALVIGRQVTAAPDPVVALDELEAEIPEFAV